MNNSRKSSLTSPDSIRKTLSSPFSGDFPSLQWRSVITWQLAEQAKSEYLITLVVSVSVSGVNVGIIFNNVASILTSLILLCRTLPSQAHHREVLSCRLLKEQAIFCLIIEMQGEIKTIFILSSSQQKQGKKPMHPTGKQFDAAFIESSILWQILPIVWKSLKYRGCSNRLATLESSLSLKISMQSKRLKR